jgi:hypothetical protein
MKAILLAAVVALSGSMAFAGALDARQYGYEDGMGLKHTPCVDGTTKAFTEVNQYDRAITVVRTCVNGRYFPKTTTVGRPCKEGSYARWMVGNNINDRSKNTLFVCVGGKYVPAH